MLWKFEFLVDGAKQMEEVLWMIQGRARDLKAPVPVVNAKVVGGDARAKHPNILAALTAECRKHEAVTPKLLKDYLTNLGYSSKSYSNYLVQLLKIGVLGPKRADGTYKVMQPKAKASPKAKRKVKHKRKAAHNGNGVSATA